MWGGWVGPEAGGASSCPAPHTALASVAGAPAGRRPRPGRTAAAAAGTPAAAEEEETETEDHQIGGKVRNKFGLYAKREAMTKPFFFFFFTF